tara:strand:+ start:18592 stop:18699 length:108 start_codon:yes stop_codon:yes gene_type:complete
MGQGASMSIALGFRIPFADLGYRGGECIGLVRANP